MPYNMPSLCNGTSVLESLTEGRRRNMAAIRNKDTKPEMYVRRRVHAAGFRFRLYRRDLPGRPDLAFPRYQLAVFVHGCFWHGHNCERAQRPRTNTGYWGPKIEGNIIRDQRNAYSLEQAQWNVFTIRECTLEQDTARLLLRLKGFRGALEQAR